MTIILAIDPAAEDAVSDTGWALGMYDGDTPFELKESGVVPGGFVGFRDSWLVEYLSIPDVVVCEKYVVFNRAGDPSPLLIEGVIRYLRPDVVLQPASGKNTLVTNDEMKRYGVYTTEGHHQDSREGVRHALVYLVKSGHKPTIRKLKKP